MPSEGEGEDGGEADGAGVRVSRIARATRGLSSGAAPLVVACIVVLLVVGLWAFFKRDVAPMIAALAAIVATAYLGGGAWACLAFALVAATVAATGSYVLRAAAPPCIVAARDRALAAAAAPGPTSPIE